MININVRKGQGDKKAPIITEALIINEPMAIIRAKQELADFNNILKQRVIRIPHETDIEICNYKSINVSHLGLSGEHLISELDIEISSNSIYNILTIEQHEKMDEEETA